MSYEGEHLPISTHCAWTKRWSRLTPPVNPPHRQNPAVGKSALFRSDTRMFTIVRQL